MIWTSKLLAQFPELIQGSTSKSWSAACGKKWNSCLAEQFSLSEENVYSVHQVHGKVVIPVHADQQPTDTLDADALISSEKGVLLSIRTADCVPVFFYAPKQQVVSVVHAGWKGTSQKIVQEVIKTFENDYKIDSSELFVAIGPAICGACYDISTVNDDRQAQFERLFTDTSVITKTRAGVGLDLPLANKLLCLDSGVPEQQIELSGICTYEDSNWSSYRRDAQELAVEIRNFIGTKVS